MSAKTKKKGEDMAVQTECSFHPVVVNPQKKLTDMGCKQFEDLKKLRDMIKGGMTELGCTTYDILAYKDVVLSVANNLPEMPVTDLLLLSSKLFRRTAELGKLLGAFFNVVFAEDFVDEDFHFVELRLAKRDIQLLQQKVQDLTAEKQSLQDLYDELGKGTLDHAHALEVLETRNDVLELRSSALEDQMAILFQQLTDEFRQQNASLVQQSVEDLDVQEQLSATRTAFAQSVETVQSRLKFFQGLLLELQDDPILQQDSGFKNKVKSLDVHVQHIVNRFTAVKEGLLSTANELLQALNDKRKALNFSVQHLKLYDVQNLKLRHARGALHDLRQRVTDVERMLQHSFPHGGVTRVERTGDIMPLVSSTGMSNADSPAPAPTQNTGAGSLGAGAGGGTTATNFANEAADSLRKSKFSVNNVRNIAEQVQVLNEVIVRLTAYLDTEEEQKALLRTISLAVPTSGRSDVPREKQMQAMLTNKNFIPSAQAPRQTVDSGRMGQAPTTISPLQSVQSRALSLQRGASIVADNQNALTSTMSGTYGTAGNMQSGGGASAADLLPLSTLREDFTTKLNFLRDVYEERISDLEGRHERVSRRLAQVQAELTRLQKEESMRAEMADREAILKAKESWMQSREQMGSESQPTRQAALQATNDIISGQVNFGDFSMESRPHSAKSQDSSAPSSGMQAFISPQARLQVQRQNAERRKEDQATAVIFTPVPHTIRGPMMRTESQIVKQERNEQLIRAMRRLTGVEEFKPPQQAVVGSGAPPPVARRLSTKTPASASEPSSPVTFTDDP